MAETTNGGAAPGPDGRRQLAINAQYVKGLPFENPRAPHALLQPPAGVAPDHNVRETLGIVDRAYILHEGQVLMEGKPAEIVADTDVRRVYLGDRFSL